MTQLSRYFNLEEMLVSQTAARLGINMTPSGSVEIALRSLAVHILDPIREHLGKPIVVTSGYRPVALNTRIGGSPTSQHCKGEAADIHVPGMNPYELAQSIIAMRLPFDQLIVEFGQWVHISFKPFGDQRGEVLTATRINGRAVYTHGL